MTDEMALIAECVHPLTPLPTGLEPDLSGGKPLAAVLFDVYGTLLISSAGDVGRRRDGRIPKGPWHDLLQCQGIDTAPEALAATLHRAVEAEHAALRRQGIVYPEVDIVRIWQGVLDCDDLPRVRELALAYELTVNPVYPMPGSRQLLAACRAAGIPTGIVSNAQFYTPLLLDYFFGSPSAFDRRLTFFSYRHRRAKPSKALFALAARKLDAIGVDAASVLYVGNDMRNDILPARRTGFRTALFAGDRRSLRLRSSDERCRQLRPDLIVTDLRQLAAAIDGI